VGAHIGTQVASALLLRRAWSAVRLPSR